MNDQPTHASCVALDGRAILLIGASGSGKSDLAIRLIDRGWKLVADDYVQLTPEGDRLLASPPENIAGKIEIRNVGVVELPYVRDVPVCLVILLDRQPERMPEPGCWRHAGMEIPSLAAHAFEASAPIKIEHSLRLNGLSLK